MALMLSIAAGLEHHSGLFDDYAYRLPMGQQTLLAAQPVPQGSEINAIALLPEGYRRETMDGSIRFHAADGSKDALTLTASGDQLWTETVGSHSDPGAFPWCQPGHFRRRIAGLAGRRKEARLSAPD